MAQIAAAFPRDANHVPITVPGLRATKSITYSGATTGAIGASTLFTVTGDVLVTIFAKCTSDLTSAGASTVEVGIAGNTAALIAQTTSTAIDNGEIWNDATPATVELLSNSFQKILVGSTNIIQTIATDTVTGGVLTYYCYWVPLSDDGNVVAA